MFGGKDEEVLELQKADQHHLLLLLVAYNRISRHMSCGSSQKLYFQSAPGTGQHVHLLPVLSHPSPDTVSSLIILQSNHHHSDKV